MTAAKTLFPVELMQKVEAVFLNAGLSPTQAEPVARVIVAGERDGNVLAAMKNVRIRASHDEIAKSLQGNWRAEHLFALKQALALYDFYASQLGCLVTINMTGR